MRILFAVFVFIHGILHLLGFLKAFEVVKIKDLTLPITRLSGLLWALAFVCFAVAGILYLSKNNYWWLAVFAAVLLSQTLIVFYWKDAKYGTFANVFILIVALSAFGAWSFRNRFSKEVKKDLLSEVVIEDSLLTENDLTFLPEAVRRYLRYTGAVGKPKIKNFKIEFSGNLRKTAQSEWMPFESVQHNFLNTSTRRFFLRAEMKHLPVTGYHCFVNGTASMDIRLFSIVPVQYQDGEEMGIAETVTFFNDMCCMASATLIDKRIKWIHEDQDKVSAEFTNNGITIRADLYFNEKGELINFVSGDRFTFGEDNKMIKLPWSTPMKDYQNFNGRKLATYAEAIYHYPEGNLCYGTFRLRNASYNLKAGYN